MSATASTEKRVQHTEKERTTYPKRTYAAPKKSIAHKATPEVFYATKKHIFSERSTIFMH